MPPREKFLFSRWTPENSGPSDYVKLAEHTWNVENNVTGAKYIDARWDIGSWDSLGGNQPGVWDVT